MQVTYRPRLESDRDRQRADNDCTDGNFCRFGPSGSRPVDKSGPAMLAALAQIDRAFAHMKAR